MTGSPPHPLTPPIRGFVDDEGLAEQQRVAAEQALRQAAAAVEETDVTTADEEAIAYGPSLLEAEAGAPTRMDVGWMPQEAKLPPVRLGTAGLIAAGVSLLLVSWVILALVSFLISLVAQSVILGAIAVVAILVSCVLLVRGVLLEVRAYRSLGRVERLRSMLATPTVSFETAREAALAWLRPLDRLVVDKERAERMLQAAKTVSEIRAVLRSQVADRLRQEASRLGQRAAMEGATVVAICPHPGLDGVLAGVRGLMVIRRVAVLHGMRPGFAVTMALLRRVAWTAAGTVGISLVSENVANQLLSSIPYLKDVVAALPGSGAVAVRLYRLAGVTAEACSPV